MANFKMNTAGFCYRWRCSSRVWVGALAYWRFGRVETLI